VKRRKKKKERKEGERKKRSSALEMEAHGPYCMYRAHF
jgi:hypothetical protein